jgi:hypothetical protein
MRRGSGDERRGREKGEGGRVVASTVEVEGKRVKGEE